MNLVDEISSKNILVVGDAMLDTYYDGSVNRISPEAPVPVFKKKCEYSVPGGASNVAANLVAAGQRTSLSAIIGEDENGSKLRELLEQQGIDTSLMIAGSRDTTVKTRFMAENNQQVLRLDVEDTESISNSEADCLLKSIGEKIEKFDLIVISDYNKGLLTGYFTKSLIRLAKHKHIQVLVDVKDKKYEKYGGAYLLKPNKKELNDLTGMPVDTDEHIYAAAEYLRLAVPCEYVLTTCGARGMLLKGADIALAVDSVGQEVFDVTGAGDTTIAYLAACLANGMNLVDSLKISNFAAGLQVAKAGTSSVYLHEVSDSLTEGKENVVHKLVNRAEAKQIRSTYKNKKIVFTNGCFDILHAGHVRYLSEAAKLGDILVLGLNSDDSTRRLKGPGRPVNTEADRAEVLCSLSSVDYVIIFDEDTPYELIRDIQPDVLVKGADYKGKEVVGSDIVKARGGKVELLTFVPGHSTTSIIEKIRK
jgi:D-beta-D-heptose 7-phosphate kinase/D-beta-D-heptose 1-phosphate adenosyltransferase